MALTFVMPAAWTDERVGLLKKLWADGYSASRIATELGGLLTRNAVIGKISRLGLSGRGGMAARGDQTTTDAAPAARPRRTKPMAGVPRQRQSIPASRLQWPASDADQKMVELVSASQADDTIPVEQRKTLFDLTNSSCRWPCGDPGADSFYFCGAPEAGFAVGRPYCARHAAIAGAGYGRDISRFDPSAASRANNNSPRRHHA